MQATPEINDSHKKVGGKFKQLFKYLVLSSETLPIEFVKELSVKAGLDMPIEFMKE